MKDPQNHAKELSEFARTHVTSNYLRNPTELVKYMNAQSRFLTMSLINQVLISIQNSEATHLLSGRQYAEIGRSLKPGVSGLHIIVPIKDRVNKGKMTFASSKVYDIAETDGNPVFIGSSFGSYKDRMNMAQAIQNLSDRIEGPYEGIVRGYGDAKTVRFHGINVRFTNENLYPALSAMVSRIGGSACEIRQDLTVLLLTTNFRLPGLDLATSQLNKAKDFISRYSGSIEGEEFYNELSKASKDVKRVREAVEAETGKVKFMERRAELLDKEPLFRSLSGRCINYLIGLNIDSAEGVVEQYSKIVQTPQSDQNTAEIEKLSEIIHEINDVQLNRMAAGHADKQRQFEPER